MTPLARAAMIPYPLHSESETTDLEEGATMTEPRYVPFRGHRTAVWVFGDLDATPAPLVCLHGGPGLPHDYLQPLERLAEPGRAVVMYDQLGCGASDRPDDDSLWRIDTFVDELATVLDALGLDRFHLLGHSWGGWLAQQYVLDRRPSGLASLVLASTCSSLPAFAAATRALKETLPADVQATLERHEAAGTTEDPEYFEASLAYITRWLIRSEIPECVFTAKAGENDHVYQLMQGPEWNVTGNLKDWDVTARLGEISAPTLVTSGEFDEMRPEIVAPMVEGIPGARWERFERSAHLAHLEETDRYLAVVAAFVHEHDA